jgi:hypothetical protein
MVTRIAAVYGVPYDIEWAREGDNIYLLQARPITSFAVQCDGVWDYAGFDDSCVLTLSMSAHAYSKMMSRAMATPDTDLYRVFFAHAYINSPLWRQFSQKLKNDRKGKPATSMVPPVRNLIVGCVEKYEAQLKKNATGISVENLLSLLELQDELNTSSFVVGEAAEYAEEVLSAYVRWINENHNTSLSIAPLVDGINYASDALYSGTVLEALSFACAADASLKALAARSATLEEARADVSVAPLMSLFDAMVTRFYFLSNRDEVGLVVVQFWILLIVIFSCHFRCCTNFIFTF